MTIQTDNMYDFIALNREAFEHPAEWTTPPEQLLPGMVVGDGAPSYVVIGVPEIVRNTVHVRVQFFPDGGRGERVWPQGDPSIRVPCVGIIPGSPAAT
jgi:hypothetical protein